MQSNWWTSWDQLVDISADSIAKVSVKFLAGYKDCGSTADATPPGSGGQCFVYRSRFDYLIFVESQGQDCRYVYLELTSCMISTKLYLQIAQFWKCKRQELWCDSLDAKTRCNSFILDWCPLIKHLWYTDPLVKCGQQHYSGTTSCSASETPG